MEFTKSENKINGPAFIKALLDRSGSMATGGLSTSLVEGINSLILEQKNTAKMYGTNPIVDIYSFDIVIEHLRSSSIKDINDIDYEEVYPRGSTALSDSIGKVLEDSKDQENVLFFIFTDGAENSSKKFKGEEGMATIKNIIKDYSENKNWTIIFGAANIDAYSTSKSYGIAPENAFNVLPDGQTVSKMMRAVSDQVTNSARTGNNIDIGLIRQISESTDIDDNHVLPPSNIINAFNSC